MKYQLVGDELELMLMQWKETEGVEARSKRYGTPYMSVPKDPVKRRAMLVKLIDTLMADPYGYEQKDFDSLLKNKIVDACVFKDHENSIQLKKWRNHVNDDLLRALATVFTGSFANVEREIEIKPQEEVKRYVNDEPVELENPIDLSKVDTGIPDPDYEFDEEFLKQLQGNGNE